MNDIKGIPYTFRRALDPEKDQLICIPKQKSLNRIVEGIDGGEYFSIFGPKQIGKTTFLHQIQNQLKEKHHVIYIDCNEAPLKPKLFYKWLINKILAEVSTIQAYMHNALIGDHRDLQLFHFLENFKPKDVKRKIIFLFDDIERIPFKIDLLRHWKRVYLERYRKKTLNIYSLITAGSVDLLSITSGSNMPYDVAEPFQLEDFTDEEVEQFINRSFDALNIRITPDAKKKLVKQLSGHPVFLQQICHKLAHDYRRENTKVKVHDVNSAIIDLFKTSSHFSILAQNLEDYRELENLIKNILKGEREKFFPNRKFSFLGVGVISEKNENCCIRNEIFKRFLKKKVYAKKISRKDISYIIGYGCLVIILAVMSYLIHKKKSETYHHSVGLTSHIFYPKYIAIDEKEIIELLIINNSPKKFIEVKPVLSGPTKEIPLLISQKESNDKDKSCKNLYSKDNCKKIFEIHLKKNTDLEVLKFNFDYYDEKDKNISSTKVFKIKPLSTIIIYVKKLLWAVMYILTGIVGIKYKLLQYLGKKLWYLAFGKTYD